MKSIIDHICVVLWLGLLFWMLPRCAVAERVEPALEGRIIQEVVLLGNFRTKNFVILRELQSKPGCLLNARILRQDRLRLENLYIFSHVRLWPTSVPDGVRLYVDVKERISWLPLPIFYWAHAEGWTYGLSVASINFRRRAERFQSYIAFGGAAGVGLFFLT